MPRVLNPLWIISLFLGLSETTAGVATTQSSGWVQGVLAVFAVCFPVIVSAAFFLILWWHPENLYAPGDYPKHMPVSSFIDGIRKSRTIDPEFFNAVIRDALESVLPGALAKPANSSEVALVVSDVIESARTELATRSISVDVSRIIKNSSPHEYILRGDETIGELLDWIWAGLEGRIRPYTYGTDWLIADAVEKRAFYDIGGNWASRHLGNLYDKRTLEQIGITAGAKLEILDLRAES